MSSNHLKTPLAVSLPTAIKNRIADFSMMVGKALPCHVVGVSGAIVTVQFDIDSIFNLPQVTMPLFGPEYIRYPIKSGDKGLAIPAGAMLGGNSGLGGGTASLTQPGNLSAMLFLPFGNTAWASVDPSAVTIYGPDGVVLRDTGSGSTFVLTPTSVTIITPSSYTVTCGATVLSLTPAGWSLTGTSGMMTDSTAHTSPAIMNAAWAGMVTYLNSHVHTSSASGSPTSAPTTLYTGGSIAP